jgi:hypothetical protein
METGEKTTSLKLILSVTVKTKVGGESPARDKPCFSNSSH